MSSLPEVGPRPNPAPPLAVGVQMHDTLASAHRLWVRGRLDISAPPRTAASRLRWWKRWGRRPLEPLPRPPIQVETQVANETLRAEVSVGPVGHFEALFDADLPPTRKGWRVARHQVGIAGERRRVCSVVLAPPAGAVTGLVV